MNDGAEIRVRVAMDSVCFSKRNEEEYRMCNWGILFDYDGLAVLFFFIFDFHLFSK